MLNNNTIILFDLISTDHKYSDFFAKSIRGIGANASEIGDKCWGYCNFKTEEIKTSNLLIKEELHTTTNFVIHIATFMSIFRDFWNSYKKQMDYEKTIIIANEFNKNSKFNPYEHNSYKELHRKASQQHNEYIQYRQKATISAICLTLSLMFSLLAPYVTISLAGIFITSSAISKMINLVKGYFIREEIYSSRVKTRLTLYENLSNEYGGIEKELFLKKQIIQHYEKMSRLKAKTDTLFKQYKKDSDDIYGQYNQLKSQLYWYKQRESQLRNHYNHIYIYNRLTPIQWHTMKSRVSKKYIITRAAMSFGGFFSVLLTTLSALFGLVSLWPASLILGISTSIALIFHTYNKHHTRDNEAKLTKTFVNSSYPDEDNTPYYRLINKQFKTPFKLSSF